jgi:hypothetical protein
MGNNGSNFGWNYNHQTSFSPRADGNCDATPALQNSVNNIILLTLYSDNGILFPQ